MKKYILNLREKLMMFNKKYENRTKYLKYVRWFINILMIVLFLIFLFVYNISINISPSLKMGLYLHYPKFTKIHRNDYVMINVDRFEFSYKTKDNPIYKDSKILKQVKGVPGDIIKYENGKLFINDVEMGFVFELNGYENKYKDGDSFTLKDDEYYVLGTSTLSFDSRYVGIFNSKEFLKKTIFLYEIKNKDFEDRENKLKDLSKKAFDINQNQIKIKDENEK